MERERFYWWSTNSRETEKVKRTCEQVLGYRKPTKDSFDNHMLVYWSATQNAWCDAREHKPVHIDQWQYLTTPADRDRYLTDDSDWEPIHKFFRD